MGGREWAELRGPLDTLVADTTVQRLYVLEPAGEDAAHALFEFQVETPVVALGSRFDEGPGYPQDLREANVEGEVLAHFVVGPDGRVVPGSFRALRSSHPGFERAVRLSLPNLRFKPATVGGRPVYQIVQQ